MGNYTDIKLSDVNAILEHYSLQKAKSFSPTATGISNTNYQVTLTSNEKILLKISNDKTFDQLTSEQQILGMLQKYNFPYSIAPLRTINGTPVYTHKDYYGVLFPFVDGAPPKSVSETHCEQIGMALASLHSLKIPKEDFFKIRSHEVVGFGGAKVREYILGPTYAKDFEQTFLDIFPNKLEGLPFNDFETGLIHADLYADNALFKDDKLVSLIDFEQAGTGRFILDIGISISGSCLNPQKDNVDISLMDAYIKGYESIRELPSLEKEHLRTAILVGFFSISLWRIKRFFEGDLDQSKKFNYRQLLKLAINFNQ